MLARAASVRPNDFEFAALTAQEVLWSDGLEAARPLMQRARSVLEQLPKTDEPHGGTLGTFVRRFPIHDLWVRRQIGDAVQLLESERPPRSYDSGWWYHLATFYLTLGKLQEAAKAASRITDEPIRQLPLAMLAFAGENVSSVKKHMQHYRGGDPLALVLLVRTGHPDTAERVLQGPAFRENVHRQAMLAEIAAARGSLEGVEGPLQSVIHTMRGERGGTSIPKRSQKCSSARPT